MIILLRPILRRVQALRRLDPIADKGRSRMMMLFTRIPQPRDLVIPFQKIIPVARSRVRPEPVDIVNLIIVVIPEQIRILVRKCHAPAKGAPRGFIGHPHVPGIQMSEVPHAQTRDGNPSDRLRLMRRGAPERSGRVKVGRNVKGVV